MKTRVALVFSTCLLFSLIGGQNPASAQEPEPDCGLYCSVCGVRYFEGRNHDEYGSHNMACIYLTDDCGIGGCGGPEKVSENWIPSQVIAEVVEAASAAEMAAVVEAYGDRLLLVPQRNAIVVMGTECNPESPKMMVKLSLEHTHVLETMRVPLLGDHLGTRAKK